MGGMGDEWDKEGNGREKGKEEREDRKGGCRGGVRKMVCFCLS